MINHPYFKPSWSKLGDGLVGSLLPNMTDHAPQPPICFLGPGQVQFHLLEMVRLETMAQWAARKSAGRDGAIAILGSSMLIARTLSRLL
jgi:hypothetical protein